jgi:aspartate kinase
VTLVVQKYGGTSVGSLDHIRNVARHVATTHATGTQVVVTISAMGDQTDDLLAMARSLSPRPPRRELDMLLTAGERVSAALLAIALDHLGVASVSLTGSQCGILTDETHGNARITRILGDRMRAGLERGLVVIVAGFQGVSPRTKEITTLGRGGTDLSAVAIAAALGAARCELYKDVRGVYTADPRRVPNARLLPRLSARAMTNLAWAGASVLHPRGAHLAAKFGVAFEIRSSLELTQPGTLIVNDPAEAERAQGVEPSPLGPGASAHLEGARVETPKIEALAHKGGLAFVELSRPLASVLDGGLAATALDWLWQQGEAPLVAQQSIAAVGGVQHEQLRLLVSAALASELAAVLARQDPRCKSRPLAHDLAAVTVVGQGFRQSPETIRRATLAIAAALATPAALVEVTNDTLTLGVAEPQLGTALAALHKALIETRPEA